MFQVPNFKFKESCVPNRTRPEPRWVLGCPAPYVVPGEPFGYICFLHSAQNISLCPQQDSNL